MVRVDQALSLCRHENSKVSCILLNPELSVDIKEAGRNFPDSPCLAEYLSKSEPALDSGRFLRQQDLDGVLVALKRIKEIQEGISNMRMPTDAAAVLQIQDAMNNLSHWQATNMEILDLTKSPQMAFSSYTIVKARYFLRSTLYEQHVTSLSTARDVEPTSYQLENIKADQHADSMTRSKDSPFWYDLTWFKPYNYSAAQFEKDFLARNTGLTESNNHLLWQTITTQGIPLDMPAVSKHVQEASLDFGKSNNSLHLDKVIKNRPLNCDPEEMMRAAAQSQVILLANPSDYLQKGSSVKYTVSPSGHGT